ncbi:hypothetical protein Cylst_6437 (plasmid) [Cylindrospermum stagnale PCC 7417]|uniref:Uncharacterized protein n=1 Tax=Cylindrospermum stagnale PCC 7417 TaxID=56107 RepID=K9X6W0_9NOST|nr:hypothetical protein [Cylindrospermum stagnale]AFZ28228.1 hypothetical protein Cylst_6437 [Cylindrospermum stagnale PCC 7417]
MKKVERESINFKLPKPLVEALRAKARELETTATDLVIRGLHHVLSLTAEDTDNGIDTNVETRLQELETQLILVASRIEGRVDNGGDDDLKQRFLQFEQKTEAIAKRSEEIALRLAQIEGAISLLSQRSSTPQKRQSYQYHPPQLELQAYTGENLAKRLGIDAATLKRELHNQSSKDFERWCRSKDPGSVGWRFGDDGLFHPIK